MQNILKSLLKPIERTQKIRGITLPDGLEFLQLIVTGPPGAGKTYYINQIRGWPNEGFIDLTANNWWKNQNLIYRPREVHLGLPFKGISEALTVFDKEWLEAESPLLLELNRIKIPPSGDSFFATDWKRKYIFEFLIPDPKTVFKRRKARHTEGYFPIDDDLSLEMVKNQAAVYREVALYLHRAAMQVYLREDLNSVPMRIVETKEKSIPVWLLPQAERTGRMDSRSGWKNLFFPKKTIKWLTISNSLQDITAPCRIAHDGKSFELRLSEQHLHFHPEIPLGVKKKHIQKNWLIFSPLSCNVKNIVGFARLLDGQSIILGRESSLYANLFDLDQSVAKRHLQITNRNGDLILTPLEPGKTVSIVRMDDQDNRERIETHRYDALISIKEIYGGPIDILPRREAQEILDKTIELVTNESFAVKTDDNRSGGLIHLPEDLTPIIIGDLHGQVDNLLKILSENYLFECLQANTACIVILGDAVHSEIAGEMEDMESSVIMMDLIFRLKCFLPNNIFYLRGNHDSFSPELSKNTIPQGILFEEKLKELRGTFYVQSMNRLYDSLPYVIKSSTFYACHAAPPMVKTSLDKIINIHEHPDLIKDITTKRVKRQYNLNGYNKKDVKRFRKTLDLSKGTPFIVGHTPLDPFGSYWKDVSNIKDHHIIYSGHQQGAQALLLDGCNVIPLGFPEEPVTKLIDKIF